MGFYLQQLRDEKELISQYAQAVQDEKNTSCDKALREEIGRNRTGYGAISILTNARHGCRQNAKDTNVVCIGDSTHNVIREEDMTGTDNQGTQRHKRLGTKRLYDYLNNDIPSIGGPVRVHIHSFKKFGNVFLHLAYLTTQFNAF